MGQAKLQRTCDKCGLNGEYRPKRWSFPRGEQEIEKGLERMKRTLDHEINRLTALQKKNTDIRPDEIQAAVEKRNILSALFQKGKSTIGCGAVDKEGVGAGCRDRWSLRTSLMPLTGARRSPDSCTGVTTPSYFIEFIIRFHRMMLDERYCRLHISQDIRVFCKLHPVPRAMLLHLDGVYP
jgi:hypothetical protein